MGTQRSMRSPNLRKTLKVGRPYGGKITPDETSRLCKITAKGSRFSRRRGIIQSAFQVFLLDLVKRPSSGCLEEALEVLSQRGPVALGRLALPDHQNPPAGL